MNNRETIPEELDLEPVFYRKMLLIRKAEEKLLDEFSRGLLSGTTHTCIGQEACAVGVVSSLDRDKDIIFSNHRCHGHFLAYSEDVLGLFGELLGRRIGVCAGIGGSQHLHSDNFYTSGIQGGIVPCATGMAFAEKHKGSGAIVAVFMGDGTLGQGIVYESLNMASLWSLPVMFVLEHNQYAQTTPSRLQIAGDIIGRATAFGVKSAEVVADDVTKVYGVACDASGYVRSACRPFFLVLHTYRLGPHSKGDDFRDPEEVEAYRKRDPLFLLKDRLDTALVSDVEIETDKLIEESFRTASAADMATSRCNQE